MPDQTSPAPSPGPATARAEEAVVFNMVWTGRVFDDLHLFTRSLLAHSGARFRFIANACPPEEIAAMEAFAEQHAGRIVGVEVVSTDEMVRHGDALDAIRARHDDGEYFAFIDPDILALGPFLDRYLAELDDAAAVTSGKEVWSHHNIRPAEHPGVNGEYFFDQDGFVFGSPHLAIYRNAPLQETLDRWKVGFSSAGNESEEVKDRLVEMGRAFLVYDTAKIVNILLQGDEQRLVHRENPVVVHIGGMSHFLAPPMPMEAADGSTADPLWWQTHDWREWDGMADRYDIAEYAAVALRAVAGGEEPPTPETLGDHLATRAAVVHDAMVDLRQYL